MKKKFLIEGMTCTSCVVVNESTLKKLKGVSKVSINLATNEANVEYNENIISFSKIKKEVKGNGFKVNEDTVVTKRELRKKDNNIFIRFILSLTFSLPVFSMMFIDPMIGISYFGIDLSMIIFSILSAIVVFVFGGHFHINAFKALLKFHFTMDSLVSLGTLIAFFYSIVAINFVGKPVYFEASVAIITLINLGKYLEHRAKTKAGDAIGKLLELSVKRANVLEGGIIIEKEIDEIKVGEVIVVNAGEKVALDGIIIEGSANIDESMLTGESMPVFKEADNDCFGGSLNMDGSVNIKVTKTNKEGMLSHIIELINNAQSSRAPIQKLADKISGIFVPVIIVISIITFISWYYITNNLASSISAAVATLVIACPCALGLATPTAIMVGTGVGARMGILIKNAETLEKTKNIDYVVFDKTGTLTTGKPKITDLITFGTENELLIQYARSLSKYSNHPMSKAISKYKTDIQTLEVSNFKEIKGKGIVGKIDGSIIYLGNKNLVKKMNLDKHIYDEISKLTKQGKTPVLIGKGNSVIGLMGLLDLPKKGAEILIRELRYRQIGVIMLTGDNEETAKYIAHQIGIQKVIAEVLPAEKLKAIKDIQKKGFKVAFVGDGINDAPALIQSDLGIAMGTGSDIAIESSDIVLVKGNLFKVVSAISLSRRTLKAIKQNLFWAFVYNIIGIPLAAFGILNPIFASFAMSMSSVSVIFNSLRIRKFKGFKTD